MNREKTRTGLTTPVHSPTRQGVRREETEAKSRIMQGFKSSSTLAEKKMETERVMALLSDTPHILRETSKAHGNRVEDLHPMAPMLPKTSPVLGLRGMVCIIGGASRGIGHGIAVRFGMAGAKVAVLGRSDGHVVTGPGTIIDVVQQVNEVGGEGLAIQCDLQKAEQVKHAVKKIVAAWGHIDVCVNNASALYPVGLMGVDEKR